MLWVPVVACALSLCRPLPQLLSPLLGRLGLQCSHRVLDALELLFAQLEFCRHVYGLGALAMQLVLGGVRHLGLANQFLNLCLQSRHLRLHALIAHRFVLAGIGQDLGAIERDVADLGEANLRAKRENPKKQ